ncbi:MAG: two-component regulator propeller domain-containing protein, partial [Anaerolineales bacterium]
QSLQTIIDEKFLSLKNAALTNDGLYVADFVNGLIHLRPGSSEVIRPSGPFSNDVYKIYDAEDEMIVVPHGFDGQYQPLRNKDGFYVFRNGSWVNFNNSGGFGYKPLSDVLDLVGVTYDEVQDKIYFASFGYGMLEWDRKGSFTVYDENMPGVTLVNSNPPGPYTLVPAIDMAETGEIWMINYNTDIPLHEFISPDEWEGYEISISGSDFITNVIVTGDNNKWMTIDPQSGGGLIVYNEELGKVRKLTMQSGEGGLPDNHVTAILEDLEGRIWIGTTDGVAYYPFPFLVFDEPDFNAIRPVYENNFLFKNETITCLEVDGGNRKWIGTDKGAWLFGPDGSELVIHYDLQNSPILSDSIIDIDVNQRSGEVFFGTNKGMISYRGNAVAAVDGHSSVKIFPNPVTPNFNGIVGIEGLPQHAIVKITDTAGNLVFQTRSEGGMATWNVLDYNGRRPETGIYLVFSSTENGDDTFVGKLAIVR